MEAEHECVVGRLGLGSKAQGAPESPEDARNAGAPACRDGPQPGILRVLPRQALKGSGRVP